MSLQDVRNVGPKGADKLVAGGINTAEELAVQRPEEVQSILGVSLKMAKDIINSAQSLMTEEGTIYNADDYDVKVKTDTRFIHTGSNTLDAILGGGWRSMSSNGVFGEFATGKSQFCNTSVAYAVDAGMDVVYVETEPNTFSKDRLVEISKSRGLKYDGKKIHIYPATKIGTVYAQFLGYKAMREAARKENWDIGLVVVDSFNAKFRRAFSGREMFPERSAEYGRHLDYLEEMAKEYNSATLLTFQVGVTPTEDSKLDQMRFGIENYPVGGMLVQHNVNVWVSVKQVKGGAKSAAVYEANLVDHSFLPKGTAQFQITERGVEDF